jgi:5-methylcytosine-specific restriction endonuclease McrA
MLGDEKVHLHHVDGNHNNSKTNNLLAVHESCHDYIHMSKGASQEHREPDAMKLRIVLDKPSNGGTPGFC